MTDDQADAALVRHLAPSIVRLDSGVFALAYPGGPTTFHLSLDEVAIPTQAELIESHRARQRALKPPVAKLLGSTDLDDLLGL